MPKLWGRPEDVGTVNLWPLHFQSEVQQDFKSHARVKMWTTVQAQISGFEVASPSSLPSFFPSSHLPEGALSQPIERDGAKTGEKQDGLGTAQCTAKRIFCLGARGLLACLTPAQSLWHLGWTHDSCTLGMATAPHHKPLFTDGHLRESPKARSRRTFQQGGPRDTTDVLQDRSRQ